MVIHSPPPSFIAETLAIRTKPLASLLAIFLFVAIISSGTAQTGNPHAGQSAVIPYASEVCYTRQVTDRVSLPLSVSPNDIEGLDLLQLQPQVETTFEHVGLLTVGGVQQYGEHVQYISSDNVYPAWYTPAQSSISSAEGTISEFSTDNQYRSKWWQKGSQSYVANGIEYQYNQWTNTVTHKIQHQQYSKEYFERMETQVIDKGVLYQFSFYIPPSSVLNEYQQAGYTVSSEGVLTTVSNSRYSIVWDPSNHIVGEFEMDGADTISTHLRFYRWNQTLNTFLLDRTVTYREKDLISVSCANVVTITKYSDWSTSCTLQGYSTKEQEIASKPELEISPNPASDLLMVRSEIEGEGMIEVRSIDGRLLMARKHDFRYGEAEISVAQFQVGLYLVSFVNGSGEVRTSKFQKQ